jgi:hypothetical protein
VVYQPASASATPPPMPSATRGAILRVICASGMLPRYVPGTALRYPTAIGGRRRPPDLPP